VKRRPDEGHRHRHGISDAGRFDDKVVKRLSTREQLVEPSDEALILEALTEWHDQIFWSWSAAEIVNPMDYGVSRQPSMFHFSILGAGVFRRRGGNLNKRLAFLYKPSGRGGQIFMDYSTPLPPRRRLMGYYSLMLVYVQ
jgi:hypothetical protein